MVQQRRRRTTVMSTRRRMRKRFQFMGMLLSISIRFTTIVVPFNVASIEQVSAYENYVTSLKFKISFLNSRTGVCMRIM